MAIAIYPPQYKFPIELKRLKGVFQSHRRLRLPHLLLGASVRFLLELRSFDFLTINVTALPPVLMNIIGKKLSWKFPNVQLLTEVPPE
jgi:hypothetical protein